MKTKTPICELCKAPALSGSLLCRSCGTELAAPRPSGALAVFSAAASVSGSFGILFAAIAPQGAAAVLAITGAALLCAGLVSAACSIRSAMRIPAPCARVSFSLSALDAIRGDCPGLRMTRTLLCANPFGIKTG